MSLQNGSPLLQRSCLISSRNNPATTQATAGASPDTLAAVLSLCIRLTACVHMLACMPAQLFLLVTGRLQLSLNGDYDRLLLFFFRVVHSGRANAVAAAAADAVPATRGSRKVFSNRSASSCAPTQAGRPPFVISLRSGALRVQIHSSSSD